MEPGPAMGQVSVVAHSAAWRGNHRCLRSAVARRAAATRRPWPRLRPRPPRPPPGPSGSAAPPPLPRHLAGPWPQQPVAPRPLRPRPPSPASLGRPCKRRRPSLAPRWRSGLLLQASPAWTLAVPPARPPGRRGRRRCGHPPNSGFPMCQYMGLPLPWRPCWLGATSVCRSPLASSAPWGGIPRRAS
jgi:hypothetical protein